MNAELPGPRSPSSSMTVAHDLYCEQVALSFIPVSMIVCVCNAIRECDVRAAARAGASCPTSAYRARGAKPRCGQCFSFAREIIAAERATA